MERENLLTPDEAAERLAVSPKTLRDWLRTGALRGVKVGRLWRVRPTDLEAFIQEPDMSEPPETGKTG